MNTEQQTARRTVDASAAAICTILSFVWAAQQIAIKMAIPEVSSLLQVGIRSLVASAALFALNKYWYKEKWADLKASDIILVGGAFTGEFFFLSLALIYTSAAHSSVLLYTAPLFAAVGLSIKFEDERLSARQWIGMALAFSGIAAAFLYPVLEKGWPEDGSWLLGDLFGLLAGASWGACLVAMRATGFAKAPPTQMLFWQLSAAGAALIPFAAVLGETKFEPGLVGWSSLAFQTFGVSLASYIVWCALVKKYLVARLGVLLFLSPMFGVALGVVVLGEKLENCFFVGSVLVLCGLVLVQTKK